MTVICIKDGVMAVDGAVRNAGLAVGTAVKWRAVPAEHGGGYVAGCGELCATAEAMDQAAAGMAVTRREGEATLIHLRADGSVHLCEKGAWAEMVADQHAEGCGAGVALGAMAAGASAEAAARIACRLVDGCSEPVAVLRLGAPHEPR